MKLIQARIRGLGATMETRWFDLSPQLNLFRFPDKESGRNFLRALETINPPYSCQKAKPFADFPPTFKQGKHTRRVIGAKRTVALTVFSATPRLVQELALISPLLYETDRIEVGRRLDYSRWINFVELASSSRWSEIEADIQNLLQQHHLTKLEGSISLGNTIKNLKPSDRIKNKLQQQLADWLQEISPKLSEGSEQLFESLLKAVCRAEHFQAARALVGRRVPLFVVLTSEAEKRKTFNPSSFLRSDLMDFATARAKSLHKKSNYPEKSLPDEINKQLEQLHFPGIALELKETDRGMSITLLDPPGQITDTNPLASLRYLQANAILAVALSRTVVGADPILLFEEAEQFLPETLREELANFVIHLSKSCQCLYGYSHTSIFPEDAAGRHYDAAELSN